MRTILVISLFAISGLADEVWRRIAWLEGDAQTNYQVDKRYAIERLKEFQGHEPSHEDIDRYLEYLSVLDATDSPVAFKQIKQFMVTRPKDRRAGFLMAVHLFRKGKRDFARYLFTQLESDKDFPWKSLVLNNLGMMALEERGREEAIVFFERATKASPRIGAPWVNLGALFMQSESFGDAKKMFAEARAIDPDFEDAVIGYATALEGEAKYDEAHAVYEAFIDGHSEVVTSLYNDAILLGNPLKKREKAAELMLRYIQRGGKESARAHEIMRSWR